MQLASCSELFGERLPLPCTCLAVAAGGRRLAVSQGRPILVIDPQNRQRLTTLDAPAEVVDLAFDRDGTLLASASLAEKVIHLWEPQAGKLLADLPVPSGDLRRVALSPSDRWLAALDGQGRMYLWDLNEVRARLLEVGLDW